MRGSVPQQSQDLNPSIRTGMPRLFTKKLNCAWVLGPIGEVSHLNFADHRPVDSVFVLERMRSQQKGGEWSIIHVPKFSEITPTPTSICGPLEQ